MGTILVGAVLALLLGAITAKLIKDRKQGKSFCGCGCENCANAGRCHKGV